MAEVISTLTTSLTQVGTSVMGGIGEALPIALPIVGVGIAVPLIIKFFKRAAK